MNILYTVMDKMRAEKDTLYYGEILAIVDYEKWQIDEVMITLLLSGWVKKQHGFTNTRYFLTKTRW